MGMEAVFKPVRGVLLALGLMAALAPGLALAQDAVLPAPLPPLTAAERGGPHDFDFEFGAWKTHLSRRLHPLTGSTTWVAYEGTSVVRPVWNGAANLGELEVSGPAGKIEGLTLRLYNPETHQWGISFANSAGGTLGTPTMGGFRDGRGEFYDQELFEGRAILLRFVFSGVSAHGFQLEQAFSDDGGKTWEANWIAKFTR